MNVSWLKSRSTNIAYVLLALSVAASNTNGQTSSQVVTDIANGGKPPASIDDRLRARVTVETSLNPENRSLILFCRGSRVADHLLQNNTDDDALIAGLTGVDYATFVMRGKMHWGQITQDMTDARMRVENAVRRAPFPCDVAKGVVDQLAHHIRSEKDAPSLSPSNELQLLRGYIDEPVATLDELDDLLLVVTYCDIPEVSEQAVLTHWVDVRVGSTARQNLSTPLRVFAEAFWAFDSPEEALWLLVRALESRYELTDETEGGRNRVAASLKVLIAIAKEARLRAQFNSLKRVPLSENAFAEALVQFGEGFLGAYPIEARDFLYLRQWARNVGESEGRSGVSYTSGHPHSEQLMELMQYFMEVEYALPRVRICDNHENLIRILVSNATQAIGDLDTQKLKGLRKIPIARLAEDLVATHPLYWTPPDKIWNDLVFETEVCIAARSVDWNKLEKDIKSLSDGLKKPMAGMERLILRSRAILLQEPIFIAMSRKFGGNGQIWDAIGEIEVTKNDREGIADVPFWKWPSDSLTEEPADGGLLIRTTAELGSGLYHELASVLDHLLEAEEKYQHAINDHYEVGFIREPGAASETQIRELANVKRALEISRDHFRALLLPALSVFGDRTLELGVEPSDVVFRAPIASMLAAESAPSDANPLREFMARRLQQINTRIASIDNGMDAVGFTFLGLPGPSRKIEIDGSEIDFIDTNLGGYVTRVAALRDQLHQLNLNALDIDRIENRLSQADFGWQAWDHRVASRTSVLAAMTFDLEAAKQSVARAEYHRDATDFDATAAHFSAAGMKQFARSHSLQAESALIDFNLHEHKRFVKEKQVDLLLSVLPYYSIDLMYQEYLLDQTVKWVSKTVASLDDQFEVYRKKKSKSPWQIFKSVTKIVGSVAGSCFGYPQLGQLVGTALDAGHAMYDGRFLDAVSKIDQAVKIQSGAGMLDRVRDAIPEKLQSDASIFVKNTRDAMPSTLHEQMRELLPLNLLAQASLSPELSLRDKFILLQDASEGRMRVRDNSGKSRQISVDDFARAAAVEVSGRLIMHGVGTAEDLLGEGLKRVGKSLREELNSSFNLDDTSGFSSDLRRRATEIVRKALNTYMNEVGELEGLQFQIRSDIAIEFERSLLKTGAFESVRIFEDELAKIIQSWESQLQLESLVDSYVNWNDVMVPVAAALRQELELVRERKGDQLSDVVRDRRDGFARRLNETLDSQVGGPCPTCPRVTAKKAESAIIAIWHLANYLDEIEDIVDRLREGAFDNKLLLARMRNLPDPFGDLVSDFEKVLADAKNLRALVESIRQPELTPDDLIERVKAAIGDLDSYPRLASVLRAMEFVEGKEGGAAMVSLDWLGPLAEGVVRDSLATAQQRLDPNVPHKVPGPDSSLGSHRLSKAQERHVWSAIAMLASIRLAPTAAFTAKTSSEFDVIEVGPQVTISQVWEKELYERLNSPGGSEKYQEKLADMRDRFEGLKREYGHARLTKRSKELLRELPPAQLSSNTISTLQEFQASIDQLNHLIQKKLLVELRIAERVHKMVVMDDKNAYVQERNQLATDLKTTLGKALETLSAAKKSLGQFPSNPQHNSLHVQAWADGRFELLTSEYELTRSLLFLIRRAHARIGLHPDSRRPTDAWTKHMKTLGRWAKAIENGDGVTPSMRGRALTFSLVGDQLWGTDENGRNGTLHETLKEVKRAYREDLDDKPERTLGHFFDLIDLASSSREEALDVLGADIDELSDPPSNIAEIEKLRPGRYQAYCEMRRSFGLLDGYTADVQQLFDQLRKVPPVRADQALEKWLKARNDRNEAGGQQVVDEVKTLLNRHRNKEDVSESLQIARMRNRIVPPRGANGERPPSETLGGLYEEVRETIRSSVEAAIQSQSLQLDVLSKSHQAMAYSMLASEKRAKTHAADMRGLAAGLDVKVAELALEALKQRINAEEELLAADQLMFKRAGLQKELVALDRADIGLLRGDRPTLAAYRALQREVWRAAKDVWMYCHLYTSKSDVFAANDASWTPAELSAFIKHAYNIDQEALDGRNLRMQGNPLGKFKLTTKHLRTARPVDLLTLSGQPQQYRVRIQIRRTYDPNVVPDPVLFLSGANHPYVPDFNPPTDAYIQDLEVPTQPVVSIFRNATFFQGALDGVTAELPGDGPSLQEQMVKAGYENADQLVAMLRRPTPGILYFNQIPPRKPLRTLVHWPLSIRTRKGVLIDSMPFAKIYDEAADIKYMSFESGEQGVSPAVYLTPVWGLYDFYFSEDVFDFLCGFQANGRPRKGFIGSDFDFIPTGPRDQWGTRRCLLKDEREVLVFRIWSFNN